MTVESVLVERGPVTVLTLNRPEKLNAWNASMRARLRVVIEECARDPDLRVLILTGAGRAFSAGEDVGEMGELTAIGTRQPASSHRRHWPTACFGRAPISGSWRAAGRDWASGGSKRIAFPPSPCPMPAIRRPWSGCATVRRCNCLPTAPA